MRHNPLHPALVVYLSDYGKSNVTTNKKGESSNMYEICLLPSNVSIFWPEVSKWYFFLTSILLTPGQNYNEEKPDFSVSLFQYSISYSAHGIWWLFSTFSGDINWLA